MEQIGSGGDASLLEAGDDSLRDMLLNQIVELQNTNDQLTSKLFTERQKSATTISQAFQKYRLERQKDTDRIQDLQNEVASLEHRNEQMQNELDRNRQLCGFAHNKLMQLQKMLDLYMERNIELQKQLDSLDVDNAQLKLACEMTADLPEGDQSIVRNPTPGIRQPCCEICLAVVETAGCLLSREQVTKLLSVAMESNHRIEMSAQTDPVLKLDRFVQATLIADDQATRPSSATTSPGWKSSNDLEDGEISQIITEPVAKGFRESIVKDEKLSKKFQNKDRPQNAIIKKRRKYLPGPSAT